ncbi:hypothetical protein Syun_012712 [Stephania yunnanensis]|uniref:Uncharacterized protein n=1 Tax=Stephania yunnanensis TaxID=152371 RepID=A0AAP0K298_9MAGN
MSRLASNPGPDIQSFRLRWSSHNYKALKCIKKWISTALSRNVAILDIYLAPGLTVFTVPAKVFDASSPSVKVIKLESHFYGHRFMLPIPMLSSPNLKILELIKIKLPKGDSNGEAILGCPVLETLVMKQCHYSHLKVLNLSLNRLKELEIDNSAERFRVTGVGDCKLELHAPNLSIFVYMFIWELGSAYRRTAISMPAFRGTTFEVSPRAKGCKGCGS